MVSYGNFRELREWLITTYLLYHTQTFDAVPRRVTKADIDTVSISTCHLAHRY